MEQGHRRIGNPAEVRKIGSPSKTESQHFHFAVEQRDGNERDTEKFKRAPDGVERYARHSAEGWFVVENVGKHTPDDAERFFVAIDGQG